MVDIYNFLNVNCFVTICSSISFNKKEALPAFAVTGASSSCSGLLKEPSWVSGREKSRNVCH